MESSFSAGWEMFWGEVQRDGGLLQEGAARLAPPVFGAEVSQGAERDRAGAVLHGLYWLLAALATKRPVALFFDDAHWLDPASKPFG